MVVKDLEDSYVEQYRVIVCGDIFIHTRCEVHNEFT